MDAPLCECHGEPKLWAVDNRIAAGGRWTCAVRRRESWRRYGTSPGGLESHRRYEYSPKGRETKAAARARRVMIGGVYLGTCGFTKAEREELVRGATERP